MIKIKFNARLNFCCVEMRGGGIVVGGGTAVVKIYSKLVEDTYKHFAKNYKVLREEKPKRIQYYALINPL